VDVVPSIPSGRLKLLRCMTHIYIYILIFFFRVSLGHWMSPCSPPQVRALLWQLQAVRVPSSTAPAVNWRARVGSCHLGNKKFLQGAVSGLLISKGRMRERKKKKKKKKNQSLEILVDLQASLAASRE